MELMVFCEFEKSRLPVGVLRRKATRFDFQYDKIWLGYSSALPLGPDLPLRVGQYQSTKLFKSFERRIPPRDSENYKRYCLERGIDHQESDPLILLGTIGHKGASSFVFELSRAQERHDFVLDCTRKLIDRFSYEIVAAAFGVNKTGLYKLVQSQVSPENSGIYGILELCFFNRPAATWKISQTILLPDSIKSQVAVYVAGLKEHTGRMS
jgi:HipA-like protein